MDYLVPLILLGLGLALLLIFTPLAWRKAKEREQQPAEPVVSFEKVLEQDLLASQIQSLEEQVRMLKAEYGQLKNQSPSPAEPVAVPAQAAIPDLELYRAVFQAYDAGKSVTEIAKELGRGKGEIQLILNLRR